jgi:myo-inositol-1-phosphate synthase
MAKLEIIDDKEYIVSKFTERFTLVDDEGKIRNVTKDHTITTERNVPRLGVMLVGLGGNNGSTFVAGILANKKKLQWETRNGT